ncbi:MAG TPA: hypothetical protein DDW88_01385 [Treponema sp.]|nr:hypothetical protein [Treponema sp.]
MKKQNVLLVLFGIIAVFAIMGCEATVAGGNTDPSSPNFLNGTTWKVEYDYENDLPAIETLSFTKTTFEIQFYVDNDLLSNVTGTYVYNAKEKKVTTTITTIIKHFQDKTIDDFEKDDLIETYEIIENGTKMKYINGDVCYTKQ